MQMQIKLIRRFLSKIIAFLRHYKTSLGDTIIIKYFCRKYCDVIRCLMTHKICSMYKRGECQIIKSRLEEPRKLMIIRNHTTKC